MSQLLLKHGMTQIGKVNLNIGHVFKILTASATNGYIILGLITMTLSMVTHILSLSRFDVSFVFPFISFAYVIVAVFSILLLGESFNIVRLIGMFVIILGTIILALG